MLRACLGLVDFCSSCCSRCSRKQKRRWRGVCTRRTPQRIPSLAISCTITSWRLAALPKVWRHRPRTTPETARAHVLLTTHKPQTGPRARSAVTGFSVHSGVPGGWEAPFTASLQLAIAVLDALPDTRPLKDAVRSRPAGSSDSRRLPTLTIATAARYANGQRGRRPCPFLRRGSCFNGWWWRWDASCCRTWPR